MKQSIIIASITVAFAMSVVGYASDIDLKSLSDNEIVQLFSDVEQELVDRNINKTSDLLPGTYVGGVDIPVGGYDIVSPAGDERFSVMLLGTDKEDMDYYHRDKADKNEDANFHISIKDGYTLTVDGRAATITINNGLNFK